MESLRFIRARSFELTTSSDTCCKNVNIAIIRRIEQSAGSSMI